MSDFEQRMRRGMHTGGTGDGGADLRSEVDRRVRRHARHRTVARTAVFVLGLLLLGSGALIVVNAGSNGGSVSVAGDERGWLQVTDPNSGLTAQYPEDWVVQGFDQPCMRGGSGIFIGTTNESTEQDRFLIEGREGDCSMDLVFDRFPDDHVLVYIHGAFGSPVFKEHPDEPVTEFPLEIDRPVAAPGGASTGVPVWTDAPEPDGVAISVGPFATKRDVDTALEIVATIHP
jgi:hypothetical protein